MTFVKVNNPATKRFDGFFNDLLNEVPSALSKTFREDVFGFPPVNIEETATAYNLSLSIPGFDKADFNVKLDGNLLSVSADKKEEPKVEGVKSIRKEFSHKSFKRSFTLDDKIDAANIAAKYENGILKLELPKKEETKAASKDITIQ